MYHVLITISRFLASYTPHAVIGAGVLAFFLPILFNWVQGDTQTAVLGTIMLTMGMTLSADDFRILAKRPFDILIGAVAQYTIMPLLAFGLVHLLHLPRGIAVGLILVGCSPGGVSSNIMTFLCHGDVAFSVGMTATSTLLAQFLTPLLMLYLAGEVVAVDARAMFHSILRVTLLPVSLGFLLNLVLGKTEGYRKVLPLMPGISVLGLGCIVGGVIAHHGHAFLSSGVMIFLAVLLHNGLGYALGFLCGQVTGMNEAKKRTLSIEVGMQNAGLATVLAGKHFPLLPEAAIASAVSCVWHSISGAILAGLFLRKDACIESPKTEA
ncbi:MAG: bile acid:sodium symporter family protein [Kiritimatiellae bacterium]|nr:bile acid:sodium symporter family protein [Kiritimatiellia bacterium]